MTASNGSASFHGSAPEVPGQGNGGTVRNGVDYLTTQQLRALLAGPNRTLLVASVLDALGRKAAGIYAYRNELVRIVYDDDGEPVITPFDPATLTLRIDQALRELLGFADDAPIKEGEKDGGMPKLPSWLAPTILAAGEWEGIQRLSEVTTVPLLLTDRSTTPEGYHEGSGVLYLPRKERPWKVATIRTDEETACRESTEASIIEDLFIAISGYDTWTDDEHVAEARPAPAEYHRSADDFRAHRWCAKWLVTKLNLETALDKALNIPPVRSRFGFLKAREDDKWKSQKLCRLRNFLHANRDRTFGKYTLRCVGTPDRTRRTMWRIDVDHGQPDRPAQPTFDETVQGHLDVLDGL